MAERCSGAVLIGGIWRLGRGALGGSRGRRRHRSRTGAQKVESVDVVEEGDVADEERGAAGEAESEAGRRAHDAVDAARATVGRHRSADPRPAHLPQQP